MAKHDEQPNAATPAKRRRHHSFDDGVDESPAAIGNEPVDVEGARPNEPNTAVEQAEKDERDLPGFED